MQKIWPWNHYADETASKWARFAYQGIVRCACSLKIKKIKKRLTNCFKFILYLSPSSPPLPHPLGCRELEMLFWLRRCQLSIRLERQYSYSLFVQAGRGGGGDFNTKALQWGNVALSGFRVYVNVVGRIARKLEWGICMNVFYFCLNVHCVRGVYLPEHVSFFFLWNLWCCFFPYRHNWSSTFIRFRNIYLLIFI